MRRIDEDIASGKFKNIYLLYGSEEYLKNQYKKKLVSALVNEGDTMNFSVYKGDKAKDKAIVDTAETIPFLAKAVGPDGDQYRVILIEDSGFGDVSASKGSKKDDASKKNADDLILDYLSSIPETTIFIFVETKVNKKYRLYKAAEAAGRAIEIEMPTEPVLQKWVGARLNSVGKKMKREAWDRYYAMTGRDMNNMDMELEKLIAYTGDRDQITVEDVNAICIEDIDIKIYELADAIADKNGRKTFDVYNEFITAKVPPAIVLSEIVKLCTRLRVIKAMNASGASNAEIAPVIGVRNEDFVNVNLPRAKKFSMDELDSMLKDAADYHYKINNGLLNDNMAVEMLMMKYVGE